METYPITPDQLIQLAAFIEERDGCKVVGMRRDDEEGLTFVDVFILTAADIYVSHDVLLSFHFERVDFANRTLRLLVFDDELISILHLISFCGIKNPVPKALS
jgi:hypothetical protein